MSRISARFKQPNFSSLLKKYESKAKVIVGRAGNMVRNTAVTNIQIGDSRSGAIRKDGTRSSGAGEYPKTDTGYLANHIAVEIKENGFKAEVISTADYSAALEFGTSKMAARPFMQPSLEENRPKIRRLVRDIKV